MDRQRVEHGLALQHFGQEQRLLARTIENIHRNALAAERRERLRDRGIAPRPVGAHQLDAAVGERLLHVAVVEHQPLVDLAGHAPRGGEVDEHGLACAASSLTTRRGRNGCHASPAPTSASPAPAPALRSAPRTAARRRRPRRSRPAAPRTREHARAAAAIRAPRPQREATARPARTSRRTTASLSTCAPSTHTSHATVAYSGNARNCFSRSIHAPGRGSALRQPGNHVSSTNGSAMPSAQRGEHEQRQRRRLREREAERRAHERRRARRGDRPPRARRTATAFSVLVAARSTPRPTTARVSRTRTRPTG